MKSRLFPVTEVKARTERATCHMDTNLLEGEINIVRE